MQRRQFMRSQPFYWQPRGRTLRLRSVQLFACTAAVHALLAAVACFWVLWAYSQEPAGGAGTAALGTLSLRQLWGLHLPAHALVLRGLQVASLLGYMSVNVVRRYASCPHRLQMY